MDSPDREPGVTMMNWTTGNGTAKYWVARLIIESTDMGDVFRKTTVEAAKQLYAQAFTHGSERRILLINKRNTITTVVLAGAVGARTVDERTGDGPPREERCLEGKIILRPFATAVVAVRSDAVYI